MINKMAKKEKIVSTKTQDKEKNFLALAHEKVHSLWEKARKLALVVVPALALTLSSCDSKTPYEVASKEYIDAQEQVDKTRQKEEKALQEYNRAVLEHENAVRNLDVAKKRLKEETNKL